MTVSQAVQIIALLKCELQIVQSSCKFIFDRGMTVMFAIGHDRSFVLPILMFASVSGRLNPE